MNLLPVRFDLLDTERDLFGESNDLLLTEKDDLLLTFDLFADSDDLFSARDLFLGVERRPGPTAVEWKSTLGPREHMESS